MSKLSDFVGGGGGLKPFNDLGTVTGTVNLDVSEFGSFRVKQGAGAVTLNVTGKAADTAGYVELFFYPDLEQAVTISGAGLVGNGYKFLPVSLTALNYDTVSFSVSGQDSAPAGLAFNNDKSKMYILGSNSYSVYEYILSTPGNLGTASYNSVRFSVNFQDSAPRSISFSSDGSKMHMTGGENNSVYQYSLSTNFDLSTASYDNVSFSVNAQDSQPSGVVFNSDGSKMYMFGNANDAVFQYTLSTNFDLSTASYDNVSFSVDAQDINLRDIDFNSDGSKMYIIGNTSKSVDQYTLSTPFYLSTASYDNLRFSVDAQDSLPQAIEFSSDGLNMYMLGDQTNSVFQYSPTYDLTPPFLYQIIHTGTAATFNTLGSDYSIEVAT